MSGENADATYHPTLGVGGSHPLTRLQLATSAFIYQHLTSVALTTADRCPTLAGHGP
jgi:hypothetical protein